MSTILPLPDKALLDFKPIYLPDLKDVELMNRVDQKFIFHIEKLPVLLQALQEEYSMLEINGIRLQRYHTVYFDSEHLTMYYSHHNGMRPRHKVRLRTYLETGKIFLEVKCKNNKNKTNKTRILARFESIQDEAADQFISNSTPFTGNALHPTLINEFSRITLVHPGRKERITIDVNLRFLSPDEKIDISYQKLCVSEIKTEKLSNQSAIFSILKNNGIFPAHFSKYCIGISSIHPQIKQNRFKAGYLNMKKLTIL